MCEVGSTNQLLELSNALWCECRDVVSLLKFEAGGNAGATRTVLHKGTSL